MSFQSKKIQTWTVNLETQAGSLAKVFNAFKEAGVNTVSCWSYEMGPGQAQGIFYSENPTQAKDVLTKIGKKPQQTWACYAWGNDQVGVYAEALNKIAKAGVNLHATDAFAVGGKFATVFFAADEDQAKLCKALGC